MPNHRGRLKCTSVFLDPQFSSETDQKYIYIKMHVYYLQTFYKLSNIHADSMDLKEMQILRKYKTHYE